jgi:hypothetical protein
LTDVVTIIKVNDSRNWLVTFTVYDGLMPDIATVSTIELVRSMDKETDFVTASITLNEQKKALPTD